MATALGPPAERNQEATCYVGNIDQQVNDEILWELFLQIGPIANVYIPKDRITNTHSGYGFIEFKSEQDADYAIKVMNMVKLFGKPIKVNKASQDKKVLDVGANIFVGNLDPEIDEKMLFDTFGAFGNIISQVKIERDPLKGNRGHGIISFDRFESSDMAKYSMNNMYLAGRQITVDYAFKKDSKEKHGSKAERLLAANNPVLQQQQQQAMMAGLITGVPQVPSYAYQGPS
ncbi:splicing factor 3B subunit 4 [Acrasis kona]|uniref:Splicing factor 3B subunit 4 n=1 Tax=Acrasis kona TaxID=1008807 RepID=A0AAW2YTQ3_9EUKA